MFAPEYILTKWNKFNDFPIVTLTKAWIQTKNYHKKNMMLSMADWANRIDEKTGYDMQFLLESLELYKRSVLL